MIKYEDNLYNQPANEPIKKYAQKKHTRNADEKDSLRCTERASKAGDIHK